MEMEENKKKIWESYRNNFRGVYILSILALIAGICLDLLHKEIYHNSPLLDLITLFCWLISLTFLLLKRCKLPICLGISAYALLFNILGTFMLHYQESNVLLYFYRDTVFIAFMITLTAYLVNKYHAFVIAGIYTSFLIGFYLFVSSILWENSITLMFSVIAYSFIIYFFVRMQEKTLEELNNTNKKVVTQIEVLLQQQEEITAQRDILDRQKKLIESRNVEIMEGIRFAKSIQDSVLTKEKDIERYFNQYFVISKPKSVISGDFFWVKECKGKLFLSVVDCTGHGVPGALVSMLANMYLGRAFIELENPDPAKILSYISNAIATELSVVDSFHSRIGMDIACLEIDFDAMKMDYAAAFSPMYMIRRDNLTPFEATRVIIGNHLPENKTSYINQTINILKGDRFYLFSDGIADQFGGKFDKKLGYKRFRNALVDSNHKCMKTQKELFWKKWLDWKSDKSQTDDVLLLGIEI